MIKTFNTIVVQAKTEMVHRYKDAPAGVEFLKDYHRHELHISAEIEVTHDDRELEFILVKRELVCFLETQCELHYVDKSCEMVAQEIYEWLTNMYGERRAIITVMEDEENGGKFYAI